MHSPGGGGNRSRSPMWGMGNVTAAERQWGTVAMVPWVVKGPAMLAAVVVGGTSGIAVKSALRLLNLVVRPWFWAGVNVYHEAQDIRSFMRGEDMSWQWELKWRPIGPIGYTTGLFMRPGIPVVIPVPFPYLDFTRTPSSGVGGPGEIPNLHRPPPSIEETGKLISNPPMAGDVPSSPSSSSTSKKSGKRCPPGYTWSKTKRKCVRVWSFPGGRKY